MKLPSNWKQKSLEVLENKSWGDSSDKDTKLVKRCIALSKLPLDTFTAGDLRIMIGQKFNLFHLIPLAIEKLEEDLFVDGDFYEGDLLENVLKVETKFWNENEAYWRALNALIKTRREELALNKISSENFDNAIFAK